MIVSVKSDTIPLKSKASSFSVPVASAASVTFVDADAPNSMLATPSIFASPPCYATLEHNICSVSPKKSRVQTVSIHNIAVDHQSAAAGCFKRSGIDDGVRASIDLEGVGGGCDDRAVVDEGHYPIAEVSGTGDGIIHVGEGDVGDRAGDHVFRAVGKIDVTTT